MRNFKEIQTYSPSSYPIPPEMLGQSCGGNFGDGTPHTRAADFYCHHP